MKNIVYNVRKKQNGFFDSIIISEYGGGVGSGIKFNILTFKEDFTFKKGYITETEAELFFVEKNIQSGHIAAGMSLPYTCIIQVVYLI